MLARLLDVGLVTPAVGASKIVAAPYSPAGVLFVLHFDRPHKIGSDLFWVRGRERDSGAVLR